MKINIYTTLNGVGLQQDANLLADIFQKAGHSIFIYDRKNPKPVKRGNIGFHLEIPMYNMFSACQHNIFIPNPEWYYNQWTSHLKYFSAIFAKTHDCKRIFDNLHENVIHTGFISRDFYLKGIKKEKIFLHIAGKSQMKGTTAIIQAYEYNPALPKCFIISSLNYQIPKNMAICNMLSDEQLQLMYNAAWFHLCPSQYEGWGHYIHEAYSCGGIVLLTDHPPMNEFESDPFLIKINDKFRKEAAICGKADYKSVAERIEYCCSLSDEQLEAKSTVNRKKLLSNSKNFTKFVLEYVQKTKT
ncbi:MAG: glycosyltransferase [Mariniphaga sp.]|nr:glycosyltransferase [Mariniphaga sp.]